MRSLFWMLTLSVTVYTGWRVLPGAFRDHIMASVSKTVGPSVHQVVENALGANTEQQRATLTTQLEEKIATIKTHTAVVTNTKSKPADVAQASTALAHETQEALVLTKKIQETAAQSPISAVIEHVLDAVLPTPAPAALCPK